MKEYKFLYFWMILIIELSLFVLYPLNTYAAENGSCGENLTWELSGDILTISGSGDMLDYSDGSFPSWYGIREEIYTIQLPSGLTSIGDYAFLGCENVTNVTIPSSVMDIGDYAFAQCTKLLQVDLGTGVDNIGEGIFQECEALLGISFPPSLKTIGAKAFYRCYGIQSLTIPVTVENMGASSFAYCTSLVRASVNAPLEELPEWTFYGCESLTDVSLASTIKSVGDFAFQNCESLNGIYTQEGNIDTAYEIEKSIPQEEGMPSSGVVGTFDMPETSTVIRDDGDIFSETEVIQSENATISVSKETDYSEERKDERIVVSALANKSEVWGKVAQITDQTVEKVNGTIVIVELQLLDNIVEAKMLEQFAGKSVILKIVTVDGVIWEIDMAKMTTKDFSGSYDLSVNISAVEPEETTILSNEIYHVKFADRIDFNVTIGISKASAHEFATLYQKDEGEFEAIHTIVVDKENIAWFPLASINKRTDYYLGINVEGMDLEEAVVPDTMIEQYDIDEEATLMDDEGTKYRVTGRTSKWGITGKQFAMYVAVAMLATVLIIGSIMLAINIIKRSKEKYECLADEESMKEKIDEEALRIEIIKEMLGKNDEKK